MTLFVTKLAHALPDVFLLLLFRYSKHVGICEKLSLRLAVRCYFLVVDSLAEILNGTDATPYSVLVGLKNSVV